MGLDGIELIMEIEKAFDISIPDQEAEKIRTVGDLHNAVWKHLESRHSNRCNSQILFYNLRKYFIDNFQISRNSFRPNTSLNDIFPKENRRFGYTAFTNSINLELPGLALTKPWNIFLNIVGLTSILGGLVLAIVLIKFFNYSNWILLIPVAGITITWLVSKFLNPFRILIRPSVVKDYTEKTLAMNFSLLTKQLGVNRMEVETVINLIIVDKIGVELDEISPEKSFTDDLGVD